MADFCSQCSINNFGKDFGDLKGLGKELLPGYGWLCICEGCGITLVDNQGKCVSKSCLKKHNKGAIK